MSTVDRQLGTSCVLLNRFILHIPEIVSYSSYNQVQFLIILFQNIYSCTLFSIINML